MTKVAVIAHAGKTFGGGLPELRRELERQGVDEPLWVEVPKSRFAPKQVKRAARGGRRAALRLGRRRDGPALHRRDGRTRRRRSPIVPAGTANLFATNLGIPQDIEQAVAIGLRGDRRKLDVGRFNGEHFAVMAGAGFDAAMIQQADGTLKDRLGRAAYVWTGSKNLRAKPFKAKIKVDGAPWYAGDASCILVGNVGRLFGGVEVFEDASPDDGRLELGVVNADGVTDWVRTLARTAVGSRRAVAARAGDQREEDQGEAEPQGALRGRRRRPEKVKKFTVKVRARARSPSASPRRSSAEVRTVQPDAALRRPSARAGEGFVRTRRVRGALSRRLRRPRARLRDHRAARVRPGRRPRRQDHEPAGRAPHRRAPSVRSRAARRCSRSGSAATRSGGSSARRSATAARAPTAGSSASARFGQRDRLRVDVRRRRADPHREPSSSGREREARPRATSSAGRPAAG